MTDSIAKAIKNVMEAFDIPFAIYISEQEERFELGDRMVLEYPEFPKTLFYDETSTRNMYEYLETGTRPRMLSQGEVMTIIGECAGNIFSFFLNSSDHVFERYEHAKEVHAEALSRIGFEQRKANKHHPGKTR